MMSKVIFTPTEEELIDQLMDTFKITRIQAIDEMIKYKKDQAIYYKAIGNEEIAKLIMDQLGEDYNSI